MTVKKYRGMVVILDGLGDRPCPELGGQTPLQYAQTPFLDSLAERNQTGLMDPILPGLPVDTHTGVSILFGLPPHEAAGLCRGPIEAAGISLDLAPGDILFRSNLCTIEPGDKGFRLLDRRAQRISDGVSDLCQALQEIDLGNGIVGSLHPATHHRCVLRLRGPGLSSQITDSDPGGTGISEGVLTVQANIVNDESAQKTAEAVNQFTRISHQVLTSHSVNADRLRSGKLPANGVITRGVGIYRDYRNILHYLNVNAAVVASESTIMGLGRLFNFTTLTDDSFTSLTDTNIAGKLETAVQALSSHDMVFVHLKGTDIAAHDRDPRGKAEFISRFDSALQQVDTTELVLGICADHSTDSLRGEHNGDPVPVLIHNPIGRRDLTTRFNETDSSYGGLCRLTAQGFLISTLDAMGHLANFKPADTEFFRITP